jgi:hypothetical protein
MQFLFQDQQEAVLKFPLLYLCVTQVTTHKPTTKQKPSIIIIIIIIPPCSKLVIWRTHHALQIFSNSRSVIPSTSAAYSSALSFGTSAQNCLFNNSFMPLLVAPFLFGAVQDRAQLSLLLGSNMSRKTLLLSSGINCARSCLASVDN